MSPEERARCRTAAEMRRTEGYAIKFAIETDAAPDDAALAAQLAGCVRAPKPEWLPAIRAAVVDYRAGRIPHTAPYDAAHALTYGEALNLAAALYSGYRLAEMAMDGYPQYELPRVPEADRGAAAAAIDEIRSLSAQVTALTRRGRDAWPDGVRLPW